MIKKILPTVKDIIFEQGKVKGIILISFAIILFTIILLSLLGILLMNTVFIVYCIVVLVFFFYFCFIDPYIRNRRLRQ